MANWEATTQQSTFDATIASQQAMDGRSATRSFVGGFEGMVTGGAGGIGASAYGMYDVVGINANAVDGMRKQIRNSVQNLQNYIDGIEAEANSDNAFRSEEIKAEVVKYVTTVKDYCKALISDLLAFSDKLADVKTAWEQSTKNFATSSVSSAASSMSEHATYYTETL